MFTGMCLSTGGGAWSGGICSLAGGACCQGGACFQRGVPGLGGGGLLRGGACSLVGGLLGGLMETPRTATAAGGTHPTGMHSCLFIRTKSHYLPSLKYPYNCNFNGIPISAVPLY